jgi:hypothetical protein
MKTLYESILGSTKDKVSKAVSSIKNLKYLGGLYRPESISLGMKSNNGIGTLNLNRLKELNKGKKMMSDTTFSDCHDDERMFELVKYLENMDIAELGFPAFDCSAPGHIYYDLVEVMENKMKEDGVFNRPDTVRVMAYQAHNKTDAFWVNIRRKSKPAGVCVIFKKIKP